MWPLEASQTETQDETHGRIIDAAHDLFLSFGIRRTTIEDIAKKAGIGRPTLYRRFADKDAIMQAVIMRESQRLIHDVAAQVSGIHDPAHMLVRAFVVATTTVSSHALTKRLLETEPELILPFMTIKAGPFIDVGHFFIGPAVKQMQAEGHFTGHDIDYLLETLARLFISIVITPSRLISAQDEKALERMAEAIILPVVAAASK